MPPPRATPPPPVAPIRPHRIVQHGTARVDDYFWLRYPDDPEVVRYIEAENAYTHAASAHTRGLRDRLYAEMLGHVREDDATVPERRGEFLYYRRTVEARSYPTYCRRRLAAGAPEQVLLDVNRLAEGHEHCRIGVFQPSPDHRLLVYSVDYEGDEGHILEILDLDTGRRLPERIAETYYSVEWANDSRTLLYNVLDSARRPHRIYRHVCGTDPAGDALVHQEDDASFYATVRTSKDRVYLMIYAFNTDTSEWRVARADDPRAAFEAVRAREPGLEYVLEHHGGRFLIVTNEAARNFKLMWAPACDPGAASWRELIPHREDVLLQGIECFEHFVVRYEREAGLKRIRISDPGLRETRDVAFPEPVYTFAPESNPEFESQTLRIAYSSLVTPHSILDCDLPAGTWTVRKRESIPSGYDPAEYHSERLTAVAPDGTAVPISIVHKRGFVRDGRHPLLLQAYGAYGFSFEPYFDAARLCLLERGWAFAIAHVRGGSERGRDWYEDGKLRRKRNTFTDFIASAEHLIAEGFTSNERLAITGTSAGGLLVGAVLNLRPELFSCAIARVPFIDVVNSMSDPALPLSVMEWDQWGNPADPEMFPYMMSYSPYENTAARAYPRLLVTAGLNDPRVPYWEPVKWVARLRAVKTDSNPLLLRTYLHAGHAGPSGRYDLLREKAFEYAFLLDSTPR